MPPLANPMPPRSSRPHWTPHACAGGLLASDPSPPGRSRASRRTVLKGTAALPIAAIGALGSPPRAASQAMPGPVTSREGSATAVPQRLIGYVFNARTQDVTLFDPVTRQVLGARPLGAVVRWLSNEQRFWDGRSIWTYDFPEDQVRAIAIDPRDIAVSRALLTGGAAPAHSLMLTPDLKTAWVNVAGGDCLAVIDLAAGEVTDEVATGKFPWDLHFTPDGRFGFTPERDQDTVSKIDLATRRVVQTVEFPAGSKPYMLRVSPDGAIIWVQTASAQTNAVLDVESMETLHTEPVGRGPVQSAFGPPGSRYGLVTHLEEDFVTALDRETGRVVQQIDVGGPQANASFMPDGKTAYVTVTSRNEVVAIDMTELAVVARIAAGEEPMGIVVFNLGL